MWTKSTKAIFQQLSLTSNLGVTYWYLLQHFKPSTSKKVMIRWRFRWWAVFLSIKVLLKLKCVNFLFFFSHHAIAPSTDYSIVLMFITYMCIGNPKIHVTRFIVILALLRWSRTKLAMSLREKFWRWLCGWQGLGTSALIHSSSVHSFFHFSRHTYNITLPAVL